jgi:integrase
MPRPPSPPRVKGPYAERDGTRFRLRVVDTGGQKNLYFASAAEAQAMKAELLAALAASTPRPLLDAIDEYCRDKEHLGRARPETCADQRERLRHFLRPYLDGDLQALTPERAEALYRAAIEQPTAKTGRPMAAASHRFYLNLARGFYAWAARRRYVKQNPFAEVRPLGRVSTGKPQLRIDEAQRFVSAGLTRFDAHGDRLALGGVLALLLGLRASEVLQRRVRDIDRGATILWIDGGKTRNARRYLDVPAVLQPRLRALCEGRAGDELLLGSGRAGEARDRRSLWVAVGRVCRAAAVPRVCPHSLRGLWATLGVQSGAVSHAVAASLGHGSFEVTARHYAQPEVLRGARTTRLLALLELDPPAAASDEAAVASVLALSAEQLLARLPPDTVAELVALWTRAQKNAEADGSHPPPRNR